MCPKLIRFVLDVPESSKLGETLRAYELTGEQPIPLFLRFYPAYSTNSSPNATAIHLDLDAILAIIGSSATFDLGKSATITLERTFNPNQLKKYIETLKSFLTNYEVVEARSHQLQLTKKHDRSSIPDASPKDLIKQFMNS